MSFDKTTWVSYASTALFVLLWSAGAIFAKLGLSNATAFAFLTFRFGLALAVLLLIGALQRAWLPTLGTRLRSAIAGLLLIGGYSICYLLALDHGITPGVLATVMGVQPILTLALLERRLSIWRCAGLMLAPLGLILVVWQSIGLGGAASLARFSLTGMLFALGALASMTVGAILQKAVQQAPMKVLPLQYAVSLLLCLCIVPFKPFEFEWVRGFIIPLIFTALVISAVAQLLLHRMIQHGNLVNVTSLFYLVPAVTALMDYVFLGNPLSLMSMAGMAVILLGLMLVFSKRAAVRG